MNQASFKLYIRGAAVFAIFIGLVVLAGWIFDMPIFTSIHPRLTSTNPVSAIAFILIGVWLLRVQVQDHPLLYSAGILVFCAGAFRFSDYFFHTGLHFDKRFFPHVIGSSEVSYGSAINFLFLGTAMLCRGLPPLPRKRVFYTLALMVLYISLFTLYGYIINENSIYTIRPFIPMGLLTAICFSIIGLAFLFLLPGNSFIRNITDGHLGGFTARRLLPYVIVLPVVLAYFRLKGQVAGYYDTGFGVALEAITTVFILMLVVWQSARLLNKIDEQRKGVEAVAEKRAAELEALNRNLERSNYELEQFAYVASHDLQEPLRKMTLFAGRLQQRAAYLSEDDQKHLDVIVRASQRMSALIHDLLNFSKLVHYKEEFQPVCLNDIIKQALDDFEIPMQEKEATVQTANLPVVQAIGFQMNQLFANLLGNALKFAQPGRPLQICIGCRTLPAAEQQQHKALNPLLTYYEITFQDNGIGFEQQYADRVFELFERLHTDGGIAGTGIGLALCKKIVRNHQGDISVRSEPGKGSSFFIFLPESH